MSSAATAATARTDVRTTGRLRAAVAAERIGADRRHPGVAAVAAGAAALRLTLRAPASARAAARRHEDVADRRGLRRNRIVALVVVVVVAALADCHLVGAGRDEVVAVQERARAAAAAHGVAARAAAADDQHLDEAALREGDRAGLGGIGEDIDLFAIHQGRVHARRRNGRLAGTERQLLRLGAVRAGGRRGLDIPAIPGSGRQVLGFDGKLSGGGNRGALCREVATVRGNVGPDGGSLVVVRGHRAVDREGGVTARDDPDIGERRPVPRGDCAVVPLLVAVLIRVTRYRHAQGQVERNGSGILGHIDELRIHKARRRGEPGLKRRRVRRDFKPDRRILGRVELAVREEMDWRIRIATRRDDKLDAAAGGTGQIEVRG